MADYIQSGNTDPAHSETFINKFNRNTTRSVRLDDAHDNGTQDDDGPVFVASRYMCDATTINYELWKKLPQWYRRMFYV